MQPSPAISTKHADFIDKQLLRAEELYDGDSLDGCVRIFFDLTGNYERAMFPKFRILIMLCELMSD